ncbi:MAG: protein-L-isoaspartate(D-aspartate) O-methyltransferase [Candidatus Nanohaloarchaeota archaeon QJJ-5]|nr:protein-L-isoaspartate(D-aspartate) O-methyltransferase [Candidatus Nanohaloarchaeota archaeon QJJ-5]
MSWEATIRELQRKNYLHTERVREAMRNVDRKDFVTQEPERAYEDHPLPIGHGQTMSAPHMVAMMTEELEPQPDDTVLEIGTGSGFQAAVLAEIVDTVYTLERISALVDVARDHLEEYDNVTIIEKNGFEGYDDQAPYEKIIVTASPSSVPDALKDELADDGRLVIPIEEGRLQRLKVFEKQDGTVDEIKDCGPVGFVPMKDD